MSLNMKYRPQKLEDIVGQDHKLGTGVVLKDSINNVVKRMQNNDTTKVDMMFVGPPGTGKTTAAVCIAKDLFCEEKSRKLEKQGYTRSQIAEKLDMDKKDIDYNLDMWKTNFLELNASDDRGIDVIRTKVKRFAGARGRRLIFLDESDSLTPDALAALRRTMEMYENCIFILSCNFVHKIIDPIQSRCAIYPFRRIEAKPMKLRIMEIMKQEGIKPRISKEQLSESLNAIVSESGGDMRKATNVLEQVISENKEITKENIVMLRETNLISDAFTQAYRGNIDNAIKTMEDAFLKNDYDVKIILNKLEEEIRNIDDETVRSKLYTRWGDLDYRCTVGSNPLIQLIWFLSYVWVVRHVPSECPAIKG